MPFHRFLLCAVDFYFYTVVPLRRTVDIAVKRCFDTEQLAVNYPCTIVVYGASVMQMF